MSKKLRIYQFNMNYLAAQLRYKSVNMSKRDPMREDIELTIDDLHTRVYLSRLRKEKLDEIFKLTGEVIDGMDLKSLSLDVEGTALYYRFLEEEYYFREEFDNVGLMRQDYLTDYANDILTDLEKKVAA